MPTYDYVCEACGHQFEHFQSMSSRQLRKCPECEKPRLKRLIGAGAGLLFKGSGFYITDYRSDSYQSDAKKDSGTGETSKKDSPKKDSSGTDKPEVDKAGSAKPAEKKSTKPGKGPKKSGS